ncbi:patatin-like phospholipase family protein [Croceimicrobium hydrocarbonivorans]|uniref:patatin-like phospholipase family protein n=1 Tax=Croceimicrobium hydrocarbonivorans TaxID=2761580 RepID=UPI001B356530|nr:patatin-like phospholipase family protein [Croceimicrobium hydrocarbonivorans]
MIENQKVHLVLASGGARGIAHIGVIERLEAAGNEIVEVAGCSMGAVVGGLYAAGKLKEYTEWLLELQRTDVFRQMDFTLARHGFVKGEKIFSTIMNLIGPQKIENLKVPFTAVATDLKTGEEVVFKKGDLYQAMRASVSIPGIFTPVSYEERKGHLLVDGGVVNPLPLNQIKAPEGHVVVAVDINATGPKPAIMKKDEEDQDRGWLNINLNFFKSNSGNQDPGLMDIISASYEHMQNQLILRDLATYKPEYLIRIPRSTCGVFDFHMAEDLIEVGRKAYDEQIIESNDAQSFAS